MIAERGSALLAILLLAGCAATAPPGSEPDAPSVTDALTSFASVCPPGGERSDRTCSTIISSSATSYQEPFLVIHPHDPETFVIGMNAGRTGGLRLDGVPSLETARLAVFVSTDSGGSWTETLVPLPWPTTPGPSLAAAGDPTLVFDERGALHVAGMITFGGEISSNDIFYASTSDLGATWTTPVLLTRGGGYDRPWIASLENDTLAVVWQDSAGTLGVLSHDAGHSWKELPSLAPIGGCITPSPPLPSLGGFLLACAVRSGEAGHYDGIRVNLIAADGALTRTETVDVDGRWPTLDMLSTGELVMSYHAVGESGTVAPAIAWRSSEGWVIHEPLRDLRRDEAGWRSIIPTALEVDRADRIHLIVSNSPASTPYVGATDNLHVVLSRSGEILARTPLDGGVGAENRAPVAALQYGDDRHSLVIHNDSLVAAWTVDRTVRVTLLVEQE